MARIASWYFSIVQSPTEQGAAQRRFAFNWLTPRVKSNGVDDPQLGDWLLPWKWSTTGWSLYKKAGATYTRVAGVTITQAPDLAVDPNDAKALQDALIADFQRSIVNLKPDEVFSLEAKHAVNTSGYISLAAALSGLTHAPAAISGSILKLSGHVSIPVNAVADGDTCVLLPSLKIAGIDYAPPQTIAQLANLTFVATGGAPAFDFVVSAKEMVIQKPMSLVELKGLAASTDDAVITPYFIKWCAEALSVPRYVAERIDDATYRVGPAYGPFDLKKLATPRHALALLLSTIGEALPRKLSGSKTLLHELFAENFEASGFTDASADQALTTVANILKQRAADLSKPVTTKPVADFLVSLIGSESASPLAVCIGIALEEATLVDLSHDTPQNAADAWRNRGKKLETLDGNLRLTLGLAAGGGGISAEDSETALERLIKRFFVVAGVPLSTKASEAAALRRTALRQLLLRNALGEPGSTTFFGMLLDKNLAASAAVDAALAIQKRLLDDAAAKLLLADPGQGILKRIADAKERSLPTSAKRRAAANHDAGLELTLPGSTRSTAGFQDRRGYAVALQHGIKTGGAMKTSPSYAAWISRAQAIIEPKPAGPQPLIRGLDQVGKSFPLWLDDTVGAVKSQGISFVQVSYMGLPLTGLVGESSAGMLEEFKKFKPGMCRLWPTSEIALPPVGYGLTYQARAVGLDNAGGAEEDDVIPSAPTKIPTALCVASDALKRNFTELKYYSIELVAGPSIDFPDVEAATELSTDTFCHLWIKQQNHETEKNRVKPTADQPPLVAVLAPNHEDFEDRYRKRASWALDIVAPKVRAAYLARWLTFEKVVRDLGLALLKDPRLANAKDDDLKEFLGRLEASALRNNDKRKDLPQFVHPGVTCFRLSAEFGPTPFAEAAVGADLPKDTFWKSLKDEANVTAQIRVERDEGVNAKNSVVANGTGFTVKLVPGSFVKLTIQSGVPEKFMVGDTQMISDEIKKEGFEDSKVYFFDGATQWFETVGWNLPARTSLDDDKPLSTLEPARLTRLPDSVRLEAGASFEAAAGGAALQWIRALSVTQHQWHWVGPPVLPMGELGATSPFDWLHGYANVASEKQVLVAPLQAGFSKVWSVPYQMNDGKKTTNGDGVRLHEADMPALRGARHIAYSVSLLARFRGWLTRDAIERLETPVWAYGDLVPGRLFARPSTPKWELAVPLAETRDEDNRSAALISRTRRMANGVLLVFKDGLYRSDALTAGGGGLGEALDVDVVATWAGHLDNTNNQVSLAEFGPNPIYEPKPAEPAVAAGTFIRTGKPFGLTHDLGLNPLVASTGLVVFPPDSKDKDYGRKWMLAKLRVRRFVWPDSLLDNKITADTEGRFPLQEDLEYGVERVCDYALYGTTGKRGNSPAAAIRITFFHPDRPAMGQTIDLAGLPFETPIRVLASLHKARWRAADAVPTWRWQFMVYVARQEELNGITWVPILKKAADEAGGLPVTPKTSIVAGGFNGQVTCFKFLASPYSEARWVSFIGLLGDEDARFVPTEDFRLVPSQNVDFELKRSIRGNWVAETGMRLIPPQPSKTERPTFFQLLMVYRPTRDSLRGYVDRSAGVPLGFWEPVINKNTGELEGFKNLFKIDSGTQGDVAWFNPKAGDQAYLLTFHRRNAGVPEPEINSWDSLHKALFPIPESDPIALEGVRALTECSLRIDPQYVGPIPIGPI